MGYLQLWQPKLEGASTIIAIDLNDDRLKMAQELGATHIFNPNTTTNIVEEILGLTIHGVSVSLDTTGLPDVIRDAVLCLVPTRNMRNTWGVPT